MSKNKMKFKRALSLVLILVVLVTAGCKDTVEDIEVKVVNRWQAVIDSNYEKAYSYLAPSVREVENLTSYSLRVETAKIHTQWQNAEFVSKECDELVCEVTVSVKYVYSFPRKSMGKSEMVTQLKENWINKEGEWFYLPKKQ